MELNFITDRALRNIWCNPTLDNPSIFSLTKITSSLGAKDNISLLGKPYSLPTKDTTYHVYQIGQWWPTTLNLRSIPGQYTDSSWVRLDKLCGELNVVIDLYIDKGIHFPLHRSYYRFTEEHGLFICIEPSSKIPINYREDTLYFRTYANKWFTTDEFKQSTVDNSIMVAGETISNNNKLLDWQTTYNSILTNGKGKPIAFVNGSMVNSVDYVTAKVGDIVEIVYDPTIIKVVDLNIKDLYVFNSVRDNGNRKYLLHYPKDNENRIEYYDDNEYYIFYKYNQAGSWKGRYYHRNTEDAVRMVTHRDYSLKVDYVRRLADDIRDDLDTPIPVENMVIRMFIRKTNLTNKPLEFENNRIHELYNLPDELVVRSMTGIDSLVPFWRAEYLENSDYCRMMGLINHEDITKDLVEKVYGYNAMSYFSGNTPQLTEGKTNKSVNITHLHNLNCAVYEFDTNGKFLGAYNHSRGNSYACTNKNTCAKVEVIAGYGSSSPSVEYGKDLLNIPEGYNYRLYLCDNFDENNGTETRLWTDITNNDNYYIVEDNVIHWLLDSNTHMLQLRADDKFLMYSETLTPTDGVLSFTLKELTNINNDLRYRDMVIPMGELEIYLNGYNLVENLDYYVDFPKVYIVNKKYLKYTNGVLAAQQLHIRFCGFCNSDFSRDEIDDWGFIVHGVLSNNSVYDIRSDRVLHIVVDGQLKTRDEVAFSEFTEGSDTLSKFNGLPYMIKDIVVPLFDTTHGDTYYYRNKSLEIDKVVSDYMTIKFPQPERDKISVIPYRHTVFSPFMSAVINAVIEGTININNVNVKDTNEVKLSVKPYEYLLDYDPIGRDIESKFVVVHPCYFSSEITMTVKQVKYLQKVVSIYCKQLIDLTAFIKARDKK